MKREEKMPAKAKSEVARTTTSHAPLTSHYRAIGPAAITAALICMRKAKPAPKAA